eukprot:scaffold87899_cov54-Phaeocystis_antarctica.AAC.1
MLNTAAENSQFIAFQPAVLVTFFVSFSRRWRAVKRDEHRRRVLLRGLLCNSVCNILGAWPRPLTTNTAHKRHARRLRTQHYRSCPHPRVW